MTYDEARKLVEVEVPQAPQFLISHWAYMIYKGLTTTPDPKEFLQHVRKEIYKYKPVEPVEGLEVSFLQKGFVLGVENNRLEVTEMFPRSNEQVVFVYDLLEKEFVYKNPKYEVEVEAGVRFTVPNIVEVEVTAGTAV